MKNLLKNKKILYLYTGNHPVHRKFAESIGATILPLTWKVPKDYDIYISEGDYFKLSILKLFGKIQKKQKILVLFSDPRLYYLNFREKLDLKSQKIKKLSLFKIIISKFLIRKLDGAICLSKMEYALLKNIAPKIKSMTHYPFIEEKLYHELIKIKPNLASRKVLFIGNGPDWYYKGVDLFKETAKRNPDLQFIVIGGEWNEFLKNNILPRNLKFVGRKIPEQIRQNLKETSLYLHIGRGEAFGVSVSEAMVAGVPSVISTLTGAKEIIENKQSNFIVEEDTDKIDNTVKKYFNLSIKERKMLSANFKKSSSYLEEKKVVRDYQKKFDSLIEKINGR